MRSHQVALVGWDIYMCIVDWLQEVEGEWMSSEGMNREQISGVYSIPQELETCRGRWYKIWCNCTNLRNTEYSVVCTSQRAGERMIGSVHVFEKSTHTSWVKNFNSVGRHLISDKIEGEIDVLKEQRDGKETIKELSWGLILSDLHSNLHLLTVCTLDKVVRVSEVHVLRPHAAKFIWCSAGALSKMLKPKTNLHQ